MVWGGKKITLLNTYSHWQWYLIFFVKMSLNDWVIIGRNGRPVKAAPMEEGVAPPLERRQLSSRKLIDEALAAAGLQRIPNPGGGNCGPHAFVSCVGQQGGALAKLAHESVRMAVVDELRKKPLIYAASDDAFLSPSKESKGDFVINEPAWKKYCDKMGKLGEYFDCREWSALHNVYPDSPCIFLKVTLTSQGTRLIQSFSSWGDNNPASKLLKDAPEITAEVIASLPAGTAIIFYSPQGGGHFEGCRRIRPVPRALPPPQEPEVAVNGEALDEDDSENDCSDDGEESSESEEEEEDAKQPAEAVQAAKAAAPQAQPIAVVVAQPPPNAFAMMMAGGGAPKIAGEKSARERTSPETSYFAITPEVQKLLDNIPNIARKRNVYNEQQMTSSELLLPSYYHMHMPQ